MDTLERKRKRLEFLKELQSRGVESVSSQIKRTETDIRFIELSNRLEELKKERNIRIKRLLFQ